MKNLINMKKLVILVAFVFVLACSKKNDASPQNYLKIGKTTYLLKYGYYEDSSFIKKILIQNESEEKLDACESCAGQIAEIYTLVATAETKFKINK